MTTFTSSRQTEIHRVLREMRVRLYTTDLNITAKNITNKKKTGKRKVRKFVKFLREKINRIKTRNFDEIFCMESLNQRKRKSKGKWFSNSKKAKYSICPGQRGFLVFCNNREKEAIKEARILFDEYLPQFKDIETEEIQEEEVEIEEEEEKDEFDEAETEVKEMKVQKTEKDEVFKLMNSGVQNVLFFRTKLKDPVGFALSILNDIQETKEQKTRFLMRLVPIEVTCKALKENFQRAVKKLLLKHFENVNDKEVKTYSVVFKARCNQDFSKDMVIKVCGETIKEINDSPNIKVEYKKPDLVIMVEVMKGNCCLGILPKYFDFYKKYNLIELAAAANKAADDRNV